MPMGLQLSLKHRSIGKPICSMTMNQNMQGVMMYKCAVCGGEDLMQDAWVPMNDPEAVHISDYVFCTDCDKSVDWIRDND